MEGPVGDVGPGQRIVTAGARERRQVVVPPCREELVLRERPGRDDPHNLARDHRLRAAFLRLSRVFRLLADRHLEVFANERQEIGFRSVDRHATHRNVVVEMLAALGQRDVERRGSLYGIVKKQLVEVPHPVEQQVVRMLSLDGVVLRHHGCGCCRRHIWSCGVLQFGGCLFCVHSVHALKNPPLCM